VYRRGLGMMVSATTATWKIEHAAGIFGVNRFDGYGT
jgi:hypothetical protein